MKPPKYNKLLYLRICVSLKGFLLAPESCETLPSETIEEVTSVAVVWETSEGTRIDTTENRKGKRMVMGFMR